MKCEKCGAEYTPPEKQERLEWTDYILTRCAFCGAPMFCEEIAKSNTRFLDFLQYAVSVYGVDIYKSGNKEKLKSLIRDFYMGEERMKRAYIRAITDDSLPQKVYEISLKPLMERESFYDKLVSYFAESNFCDEEVSKDIVDSFVKGLSLNIRDKEVEWLVEEAEEGDKDAQNNLGHRYYTGQGVVLNYEKAQMWFRKSAEQGNMYAQRNLGLCYEYGRGVPQDYSEAVKWYRKSVEQGNAIAQNNLGLCYEYGRGIPQDYSEAVRWYCKSAEQGNSVAQCNLGYCYEKGYGVPQDYAEAVNWYRKSAEQGNARAQNNLGVCLELGLGIEQNCVEAVEWYKKSASQGYKWAKDNLKKWINE